MSDVVWMTAKFHEAKPSEICHPNYNNSVISLLLTNQLAIALFSLLAVEKV